MPPPASDEESDAALVRACLEGAPGAFDRLIERHRRVVYHAIRTALDRTAARDDQDLCDEAFVRVFSALAADQMKVLRSFEGRSRLATFLVVVARRTALRTLADLRPQVSGRAVATEPLDPAPDPAERAEREEARALVRESIGTLGERDALAIRLFYEQNLSHREIGAALGVPVTHVGQILSRAREKLRARLDRKGLGLEHVDGVS